MWPKPMKCLDIAVAAWIHTTAIQLPCRLTGHRCMWPHDLQQCQAVPSVEQCSQVGVDTVDDASKKSFSVLGNLRKESNDQSCLTPYNHL